MSNRIVAFVLHWLEIAFMAVVCLWEELKGEEPTCSPCWKCSLMRTVVLCVGAFLGIHVLKILF